MKAIAQAEAEETQQEKSPAMFVSLLAARARREDCIISAFQWKHYDYGGCGDSSLVCGV
jgi:hypothetical protein